MVIINSIQADHKQIWKHEINQKLQKTAISERPLLHAPAKYPESKFEKVYPHQMVQTVGRLTM